MQEIQGCFVQLSGTENVVQVAYVKAELNGDAHALASKVVQLVHSICNGVDDVPSFPTSNL